MSPTDAFTDFLRRIRAGDQDAASELVCRFESVLRIEIRRRINDPYLNRVLDSADVCQSVLASFFVRVTAGQFDLHCPDDLLRLLMTMARNKVASKARKHRVESKSIVGDQEVVNGLADGPQPDRIVAGRELLERFRQRLTEEERLLLDLKAAGRTWPEIAEEVGGNAQARRRQLDRAVARVCRELGLEDDDE